MKKMITGEIHTANYQLGGDYSTIRTPFIPRCFSNFLTRTNPITGEITTRCVFNPSKATGECKSLMEYGSILRTSLYKARIDIPPELIRLDFKFDNASADCTHWLKLWEALIYCFAVKKQIKSKGRYRGGDFWTLEHKSTKVTTDSYEIEVYHKAIQKESAGVTYRAEIRKVRNPKSAKEALEEWQRILRQLPTYYSKVTDHYSGLFFDKWCTLKAQTKSSLNLNQFIRSYDDFLFNREQLKEIYCRIGLRDPSKAARNYMARYAHDFITQNELAAFAEEMCEIIQQYIVGNDSKGWLRSEPFFISEKFEIG